METTAGIAATADHPAAGTTDIRPRRRIVRAPTEARTGVRDRMEAPVPTEAIPDADRDLVFIERRLPAQVAFSFFFVYLVTDAFEPERRTSHVSTVG